MKKPTISLVSPARNEGPFLLEWIAWHKMIGFNDILVLTHDCTDGSDILLDALEKSGFIRHIRHRPPANKMPLTSAYTTAKRDPTLLAADWVMVLDTDEYLQVFVGNKSIHDLVCLNGQACLGMAVNWKAFGTSGQIRWEDTFVRNLFTHAADGQVSANMHYKSIFRELSNFGILNSHTPSRYSGEWGGRNVWVDSEGKTLKLVRLKKDPRRSRALSRRRVTHVAAQVNHYAVKSLEGYALKQTQKSGARQIYRHNTEFFEKYNCNDTEDLSAQARNVEFEGEYSKLTQDPKIVALHHMCCAHYVSRLALNEGQKPEDDPRFIFHRSKAGKYYR